jgi:uncharacterized membrane protein HdeD (DUF308 family)
MALFYRKYWWVYLLRGIFAVLFGILALLLPGPTFATIVIFFGAFMFVDGIFSIIGAFKSKDIVKGWGWLLFFGIIGLLVGIITLINPFAAMPAVIFLFAFWAFMTGILEIAAAIRLRKIIKGEGWYILAGILTVIFAFLIILYPVAGVIAISTFFGIYALVYGVLLIALSIRLKKHREIPVTIA